MKKLLIIAVPISIFLYFLIQHFNNSSLRAYTSFPEIDDKFIFATLTELDKFNEKFPSKYFYLYKSNKLDELSFSFISPDFKPLRIKLNRISALDNSSSNIETLYESVLIDTIDNCRIGAKLIDNKLEGLISCNKNLKTKINSLWIGKLRDFSDFNLTREKDEQYVLFLDNLLRISELEDKNDKILKEEARLIKETKSFSNNLVNSNNIKTIKEEISELEKEVLSLEERKKIVFDKRKQLFRVSEKGTEIELEKRLSRLEFERLISRAYLQKNEVEDFSYEDRDILQSSSEALEDYSNIRDENLDNSRENQEEDGRSKDWWKMID